MSTRSALASALASLGVLGLGWGVATADGQTVATQTTTNTTTDSSGTSAPSGAGSSASNSSAGTSSSSGGTTAQASTTDGLADGTWTGATATHRFGSVTVTVTIADGTITSLTEQVVSDGDRKSDQINARSIPTIRSSILTANSADVSTVSGATYTTRAYLTSLQSALDQAGS